jgi:sialate O-acetylesterase
MDSEVGPFHDGPILGFAIAGKDGHFQPAKAEWLDKNARNAVVLTSLLLPEPLYFRYAWARNPFENLKSIDHTDLPFDTQRNDTWTLADMYEIYTGNESKTPNILDGQELRQLIKGLQADDLKRRIEEAKALLNASGIGTGN